MPTDVDRGRPPVYARAPWDDGERGPRVTGVRTIVTAPDGPPLLVVRVDTDVDGLIGWGCASSPQRPLAIRSTIDDYLGPMLVGRRALDIEDFHHLMELSPYWRGGAIENNALAGIDIALWDIKAKVAGLPLHQLLGGQARSDVPVYGHADGADAHEVIDSIRSFMARGYRYIRAQVAVPGSDTYGTHGPEDHEAREQTRSRSRAWHPADYPRTVVAMFDEVRDAVGPEVELLHDVHERVGPMAAIRLARDLEPYRLFFLEDAIAPEDLAWYREMRTHTTTPQAVGETFSDISTFLPLVSERLIDFARIRLSAVGGITPTVKLAHLCEFHGVRLAIHGPGDISPIGHAASIAVDASSRAFGIQESTVYSDALREVFPGAPVIENGAYRVPQMPGVGAELDEQAAARYAPDDEPLAYQSWSLLRREDGSATRP